MQYIIIAPACNVPLPGTNPKPNQMIIERAVEIGIELAKTGLGTVVIFTDGYTRKPEGLDPRIGFVQGGPKAAISQVMFLRQLKKYLQSLTEDYRLVGVLAPHYYRRWRRDTPKVLGVDIPVDSKLLKTPIRSFFSPEGADIRSRHMLAWLTRELAIEIICFVSWELYAKLSS